MARDFGTGSRVWTELTRQRGLGGEMSQRPGRLMRLRRSRRRGEERRSARIAPTRRHAGRGAVCGANRDCGKTLGCPQAQRWALTTRSARCPYGEALPKARRRSRRRSGLRRVRSLAHPPEGGSSSAGSPVAGESCEVRRDLRRSRSVPGERKRPQAARTWRQSPHPSASRASRAGALATASTESWRRPLAAPARSATKSVTEALRSCIVKSDDASTVSDAVTGLLSSLVGGDSQSRETINRRRGLDPYQGPGRKAARTLPGHRDCVPRYLHGASAKRTEFAPESRLRGMKNHARRIEPNCIPQARAFFVSLRRRALAPLAWQAGCGAAQ